VAQNGELITAEACNRIETSRLGLWVPKNPIHITPPAGIRE